MNEGRRLIRYTVFGLLAVVVGFVAVNRLYGAVVDADTPRWLARTLSLGLHTTQEAQAMPETELAQLAGFSRLAVFGRFNVEIVGSPEYRVTFVPAEGSTARVRAWQREGGVRLVHDQYPGTGEVGTLRIEVPSLERMDIGARRLLVQGLQAGELQVFLQGTPIAELRGNHVESWKLFAGAPLDLRVDEATLAAGSLQTRGEVTIRRAD